MSKIAVILFPGLNTELETLRACRLSGLQPELFRWNDDYSKLKKYDAYIVPGGFSYEDRGRSGVVASKDPIMHIIKQEIDNGKPGLGICNGAQIFVESGIIPGLRKDHLDMSLAPNERIQKGRMLGTGYYNDWIFIKHETRAGRSVFNRFPSKRILHIPIAHGEGRFTTRDPEILKRLIKNEQALFRYCDENGNFINEFPVNPNGALYNLAGVCNPQGNALALMPHTERSTSDLDLFHSLNEFLSSSKKVHFSLPKQPVTKETDSQKTEKPERRKRKPDITILVELIITDNEEKTIENTVKKMGYPDARLSRQVFLGIDLKNKKDLKKNAMKLIESGEILNLHKEIPTILIEGKAYGYSKEKGLIAISGTSQQLKSSKRQQARYQFYTTEYNNYSGKNLAYNLKNHLPENPIQNIERGTFWTLETKDPKKIPEILQTHIFHNPHSMRLVEF